MILAIETGLEPEYEQALQDAARAAGWGVRVVGNVPFTDRFVTGDGMATPLSDSLLEDPAVWFHGSIQAAMRAQQVTRWQVHAPWEQLRCRTYYAALPERILQRDHVFLTLGELPERIDSLFASELAVDGALFVRPDGNDKAFTGCVHADTFAGDYALLTAYEPPPETLIVVARPQRILAEARFLVVGGEVVTGSLYRSGGQRLQLEAHDSLMAEAAETLRYCLAQGFDPAPSWVLDLAQTADGWSIIEVGGTSICGLYRCDLASFVRRLEHCLRDRGPRRHARQARP